ncbi:hypothetical protein ACFL3V_05120 [Nanoarchaeota archaeon]
MQKKRWSIDRKAQLSMFFLMGFFLVGIFAFMWYANQQTAQQQLEAPTEKLITDLLKTGAIPYYVMLCLENASKTALNLVGHQGGDIFLYQYGPAPNPTNFINLDKKVTYGIMRPYLEDGTSYPNPPGYPGGEGKFLQGPYLNFKGKGRFGEVSLRRLCDTQGVNSPYSQYMFGYGGYVITAVFCQAPYIYSETMSTQWQMEQFIENTLNNCTEANWENISKTTGYDINQTGPPNITVRLGTSDVNIDAFIPMVIKVGGREPVYTVADYHARFPVRLKKIVELASYIATYDSFALWFNISSDFETFKHLWDSNIHLKVSTPMKSVGLWGLWDDIITIEDSASVLDGKNYIYRFVRQNRHPVLDYIHEEGGNLSQYDVVVMEDETIRIDPNPDQSTIDINPNPSVNENVILIYDPDEDNLTYYYTGWKETCDEKYDTDFNRLRVACSAAEPTHPSNYFDFPNNGVELNSTWESNYYSQWTSSPIWAALDLAGEITSNPDSYPSPAPMEWTSSDAYLSTGRNATFTPQRDDIGPHNVTVWVCDEGGLCDYQIIRILVIDYPRLVLNGSHPYRMFDPNIPPEAASVEDYYEFDAGSSTGLIVFELGLVQGYLLSDLNETFNITFGPTVMTVDLPRGAPYYSRDIRYIWNFTFNRTRHCELEGCSDTQHIVNHTIELSVPTLTTPPRVMNVSVHQCLPLRNEEHPYPWPYNNTEDSFLASHTCCSIGPEYNITIEVDADHIVDITDEITGMSFPTIEYLIRRDYDSDYDVRLRDENENDVTNWLLPHSVTNDRRINITFDNSVVPVTNLIGLTLKINVFKTPATADSYPGWGAWLPDSTTCYGGIPKIGLVTSFNETIIPYGPPDVGETTTEYSGVSLSSWEEPTHHWTWTNDFVVMNFKRFCSGDRGNICNGLAERYFRAVKSCPDMDRDNGEIESCKGPPPTFSENPVQFSPDLSDQYCDSHGMCLDPPASSGYCNFDENLCYNLPSGVTLECDSYHFTNPSRGSFEEAFGLNRTGSPDVPADGTCNERSACSVTGNIYDYDISVPSGPFLIRGARCNHGECTMGGTRISCSDYNGRASAEDAIPSANPPFCESLSTGPDNSFASMFTLNYECRKDSTTEIAGCNHITEPSGQANPDNDQQSCEACRKVGSGGFIENPSSPWVGGTVRCCGDDAGEGGYPYGDPGVFQSVHAERTSGNSHAGNYNSGTEFICDDYHTTNFVDYWIDNDCDGEANCIDDDCAGNPGPNGITCCRINNPSDCESTLHESETLGGIECDTENECNCIQAMGVSDSSLPSSTTNLYRTDTPTIGPAGVKLCIASYTETYIANRHMKVRVPSDMNTIYLEPEDVDGGSECAGLNEVQLKVWDAAGTTPIPPSSVNPNTDYIVAFENYVDEDCIVTIKVENSV